MLGWLRWKRIELKCPICGMISRVPERWLDGSDSFRCDCDRYTYYPEAERLRRLRQAEVR
jgi:hypothetical protein